MAGGASIIVYTLLSAIGLNPVAAATTTAIGVMPANFVAARHHGVALRKLAHENRDLIAASVIGTLIGAYFLLTMPMATLQKVSPFLVLLATLTLFIPNNANGKTLSRNKEAVAIFGTGLYCGYFGPGQGVMVSATLARDARRNTSLLNATKNVVIGWTVVASNILYTFSGHVHWIYAGLLAVTSALGGHLGGKFATTMSARFYRNLVICVGLTSTVWLFTKYY